MQMKLLSNYYGHTYFGFPKDEKTSFRMAKIVKASLSNILSSVAAAKENPPFLNCVRIEKGKCKGINMKNIFPFSYSSSSILKNCCKLFWILDWELFYLMKKIIFWGYNLWGSAQKFVCLDVWLSLYMPSNCNYLSISQIVIVVK